ncbi:MAG: hypothetical protein ACPGWR_17870 [Ardenticatenaceae bacterium]
MPKKIRKQIYIESRQNIMLKRLVKETGMSEAALIRQAIDYHTQSTRFLKRNLTAWHSENDFIGELIKKGPVSTEAEWDREGLYE